MQVPSHEVLGKSEKITLVLIHVYVYMYVYDNKVFRFV